MFTHNVPKFYWGEAVLVATHLINRMSSKTFNFQTPMEILTKSYPNTPLSTSILERILAYVAYVHNDQGGKLDPRALKCIFFGYSSSQKGYKCYSPNLRKFFITMNVTFEEA